MGLDVLFWFYREPEVCAHRLRMIRRFNPEARIFGLYGGAPDSAAAFQSRLGGLLDDFYAYEGSESGWWKWVNGDLLISAWYRDRGRHLTWQAIFVAQWDMLTLGSLVSLVGEVRENDIVLSGLRPVADVESWWWWVRGDDNRAHLDAYMAEVRRQTEYTGGAWCCQFVLVCMGRAVLEGYSHIAQPELGFIEYRVPTWAAALGANLSAPRLDCWWEGDPETADWAPSRRVLSACRSPVRTAHVLQAWLAGGAVVVHPYTKPFPLDAASTAAFMRQRAARAYRGLTGRNRQAKTAGPAPGIQR